MSTEDARRTSSNLSFTGISLLAHVLFFIFVYFKFLFFVPEKINFEAAIRVDIVDLPDKITAPIAEKTAPEAPEPKKAEPVEEKKPEVKKEAAPEVKLPDKVKEKDAVNLNKAKSKQLEALNKLKTQDALSKINQDIQKDALKSIAAEKPKYKGAALSAGTAITGVALLQHESYVGDIDRHVKKFWSLPQWLINKNYKAQILVKLDKTGRVISANIIKPSGNPSYDEHVVQAVQNASPFPAPPEKFVSVMEYDGVTLGFPE